MGCSMACRAVCLSATSRHIQSCTVCFEGRCGMAQFGVVRDLWLSVSCLIALSVGVCAGGRASYRVWSFTGLVIWSIALVLPFLGAAFCLWSWCSREFLMKFAHFPLAFPISLSFTHELSSLGYPTHFTIYWRVPCRHLESNTSSTSYSSPSFVIMGGGATGPCCSEDVEGLAGRSRTVLNTGWIRLHVGGSCNLYARCPTFATIGNGPYRLSSSFFEGRSVEMLEPSKYTLSPT